MKQHPVFTKCLAEYESTGKAPMVHLTDIGKLIRATLKARFPGVKFSVRCDRYAGGSSIDVRWADGPLQSAVQDVIAPYAGSGFDGMIDMSYCKGSWLYPDGSAGHRSTEGTTGSRGSVPAYDMTAGSPDAIPVSFLVSFVFAHRRKSAPYVTRMLADYASRHNDDLASAIRAGHVTAKSFSDDDAYVAGANNIRIGDEWADTVLHRFDLSRHTPSDALAA